MIPALFPKHNGTTMLSVDQRVVERKYLRLTACYLLFAVMSAGAYGVDGADGQQLVLLCRGD